MRYITALILKAVLPLGFLYILIQPLSDLTTALQQGLPQ